jgi:hypothetical protein
MTHIGMKEHSHLTRVIPSDIYAFTIVMSACTSLSRTIVVFPGPPTGATA